MRKFKEESSSQDKIESLLKDLRSGLRQIFSSKLVKKNKKKKKFYFFFI